MVWELFVGAARRGPWTGGPDAFGSARSTVDP